MMRKLDWRSLRGDFEQFKGMVYDTTVDLIRTETHGWVMGVRRNGGVTHYGHDRDEPPWTREQVFHIAVAELEAKASELEDG